MANVAGLELAYPRMRRRLMVVEVKVSLRSRVRGDFTSVRGDNATPVGSLRYRCNTSPSCWTGNISHSTPYTLLLH